MAMEKRKQRRSVMSPELRRFLKASLLLLSASMIASVPPLMGDEMSLTPVKVVGAAMLAFLPGWLFVRFVVFRSGSVWDEYVLNLHRLGLDEIQHLPPPPRNSIYYRAWKLHGGDQQPRQSNIYIQKFEAHYGKGTARDEGDGRRFRADTFFPVILTTVVFAVGWVTVLWRDFDFQKPTFPGDALCFAFMGAYLFTLQMLVRRYFQADLKTGAYVSAAVRTVTALIVALGPGLLLKDGSYGTFAVVTFMVGFFPIVGLQAMQKVTAVALRTVVPTLRTNYPLSDLDGLTVWYESRLLELGVEDAQNLATANLVDVLLHSRVPVARLIDWVDQAILYLHLKPEPQRHDPKAGPSDRARLRQLGIRSATTLEAAFSVGHSATPAANDAELVERLRWVLNESPQAGPSVTEMVLKTIATEPNLDHVRHWKQEWRGAPPAEVAAAAKRNGSAGPTPPDLAALSH